MNVPTLTALNACIARNVKRWNTRTLINYDVSKGSMRILQKRSRSLKRRMTERTDFLEIAQLKHPWPLLFRDFEDCSKASCFEGKTAK